MGNVRKDAAEGKPKMDKSSVAPRRCRIEDGPWGILHRTRSGVRPYIARGFASKRIAQQELNDLLRYYPEDDHWRSALFVGEISAGAQSPSSEEDQ